MLIELTIRNVAIIEEISISLGGGLTIFTGETGSGKSILIESLMLALGGRASNDLIRTGEDEAEVSALFNLNEKENIQNRLKEASIPVEDELLLRRIVSATGRSRAYINDRSVTVAFLREIGQKLIEISGQHEHQYLMQPRYHLELLDNHGDLWDERLAVEKQYHYVKKLQQELQKLGGNNLERSRRKEYLLYQIEEMNEIDLDTDEQELEEERRYFLQLGKMLETSQYGEELLYSGQGSITELLGRLTNQLSAWIDLSEEMKEAVDGLSEAQAVIDDVSRSLRGFLANTEQNPNTLIELETILSQLRDLKRKHGVLSVKALKQTKEQFEQELETLNEQEERLLKLEHFFDNEVKKLRKSTESLSKSRRKIARRLSKELQKELSSVGMKKARFITEFQNLEDETQESEEPQNVIPGPTGQDQVQFLLSSNPGEEPRSLQRVASGGELSRIMLSFKHILTEKEPVQTCIFDEVDSGIGGFTATIIGQKIKKIAKGRQVICITHLPQLACFADEHFQIQKREKDGRTCSTIQKLTPAQREKELARMLGGVQITSQSRAHAKELLAQAKEL